MTAVMTIGLVTVGPATPASEAERIASVCGIRHLLVVDGGDLCGVACVCDLWPAYASTTVAACVRSGPITIDASASIEAAAFRMREQEVDCLPVVRGERLIGVVTRRDLRRTGQTNLEGMACLYCGGNHHVRVDPRTAALAACLECLDRAASRLEHYDDLGGGD